MDFSDIILYFFLAIFFVPLLWGKLKKVVKPAMIEVITLNGIIHFQTEKTSWFTHITSSLTLLLKSKHPPKALIIRINSPGGTVGASQELYSLINKLRKRGVKVIACLEDVAASGGLYVSMAADYIVSNPGTITGSIGVIMGGIEYSQILEFFKLKPNIIKSGKFKDTGSPLREMTDEDKTLLQEVVQNTYEQFVQVVAHERKLPIETVKSFADGRILNGSQAKALGLVDELGGFEEAVAVAMKLAKIPKDKRSVNQINKKEKLFGSFTNKTSLKYQFGEMVPEINLPSIPLWLMPRF